MGTLIPVFHFRRLAFLHFFSVLFGVVLLAPPAFSQIPNGGFENWTIDPDSNFNPVGWETTNSYPFVNVERVSPACQGTYAVKVKTVNFGFPFPGVALLQTPFNFTQLPTRFRACIRATIMPGDRAYLIVGLMLGDSLIAVPDSCTFKIDSTISQPTYREFPLILQSSLVPDSLVIIIASGLGTGQVGTELIVDDVALLTGSADVGDNELPPGTFSLRQNYPNPFNPSTTIDYEIPLEGTVELHIFDLLGRHIASLVNGEQSPGRHTVVWNGEDDGGIPVAGGLYFYRLRAGSFVETRKLTLLK